MSSRRARTSTTRTTTTTTTTTDDELNELVSKLQTLLPLLNRRQEESVPSASKILKETCSYIRGLHCEVDELSQKLSQLLVSKEDTNGIDLEALKTFLQQKFQ